MYADDPLPISSTCSDSRIECCGRYLASNMQDRRLTEHGIADIFVLFSAMVSIPVICMVINMKRFYVNNYDSGHPAT